MHVVPLVMITHVQLCVDFAKNGVDVTMLQRSPTYVMSVDKGMSMLVAGLYSETSPPTDLADRIAESNPKLVAKLFHKRIIPELAKADKDLLDGVKKAGFKSWLGPEDAGFLMSESASDYCSGGTLRGSGSGEGWRLLLLHGRI